MAQLQDAGVTAGTIFVALTQFAEETLQRRDAGSPFGPQLATLTGGSAHCSVARVKETRSLTTQVQRASVGAFVGKTARAARKRDRSFDKRAQLFRFRQRGSDPLVAGVDQGSREVAQHRVTMLAGATEFSMCL
jgi:hypothetical protein